MRTMTKTAFAAALSLSTLAALATLPAATAADRAPKQQSIKLGANVRKIAVELEALMKGTDTAATEAKLVELEAAVQTDDEKYFATVQRLAFEAKRNNMAGVGTAITALISNPRTPASDLPRYYYFRGTGYYQAKKYTEALADLQRAQELGYTDTTGDIRLKIVQSRIESGDITGGIAQLQQAVTAEKAAGRAVPDDWYRYAVAKLAAAKMRPELATWLKMRVTDYPSATNWRTLIVIYRDGLDRSSAATLDRNQKLDLFRLMRATKSLADQNDYWEYAELSLRAGLPTEAKAVIEEGRAAGKVLPSHAPTAQIYTDAVAAARAEGSLTGLEARAKAGADGKLAASTGDAYLGSGQYAKAIELYRVALSKGGVANTDELNTHLGIALAMSGNTAEARTAFAAVKGAPRNDIAGFWTFFLDHPNTGGPATAAAAAPAAS